MDRIGIVIQARSGSTRLPKKMLMPFYEGKTILEIILDNLKRNTQIKIVLATTTLSQDDELCLLAEKSGIEVYRGDENNVLSRFIEASEKFGFDTVVRVCADNPFLNMPLLNMLINQYSGEDYFSFKYGNGKPTILGHLGLFCEITNLKSLKHVAELTEDKLYLEHVTNFIYNHLDTFNVQLIDLPKSLHDYEEIRLTVDTQGDFENTAKLFDEFGNLDSLSAVQELIDSIRTNGELLSSMKLEITKNTK